jgi:glycosyltransferase involved in cell wall biosynthesis
MWDTRASTPLSEGGTWITVVRNIPMPRALGPLPSRAELGLPEDRFILVLQGSGINVQRGGEEAVLAMRELPNALLLVIGGGDAWPVLEQLVKEHDLGPRVRLMPRMPYERMMAYTRNADLGLSLDKDTNLNYRYSLPNKLFDYFRAGIPVLVTDLPEVAAVVRGHGAGVVIPRAEPGLIAAEVRALQAHPEALRALREKAIFAAASLDGAREMDALKAFLQGLG